MANVLIVYVTRHGQTEKIALRIGATLAARGHAAELLNTDYADNNFLMRFIMRRIAARAGGDIDTSRDHEYTDWDAVDRFASEFVAEAAASPRLDEPTRLQSYGSSN